MERETEVGGYAIRFGAEKCPNTLAGETVFPWLPTTDEFIRTWTNNARENRAGRGAVILPALS